MTRHPFLPSRSLIGEAKPSVFVEFGMILAIAAAWTAVYCVVCPLEAYAAEAMPWLRDAKPVMPGHWEAIAIGFLLCGLLAAFIVTRIFAIAPRDDEPMYGDPDKGERL